MRRLWRSTSGVVLLVGMVFALATVGIGVLAYGVTHEALEKQLNHRAAVETRSLLDEARTAGLDGIADTIRRRSGTRSTASLDYILLDDRGRVRAATVRPLTAARPGFDEFFHFRRGGDERIGQALTTRLRTGLLVVVADRADLIEIDWTLARLYAYALAATLMLGLGAATAVGVTTHRRLAQIDATALAIIAGDLKRRVPRDHSNSEFDRLAVTLNLMLDRIGGLMDNLRQISSDVAHDLRTPLTRLSNQLELALEARDGEDRTPAIVKARDQAAELLEIFAALLRITEVEGLAERRFLDRIDLTDLISEMVETFRPDIEVTGHALIENVEPGLYVSGDRRLIAQALSNVFDNAIRHTPPGTTVRVDAATASNRVRIVIEDDGPGVGETDAARIFQRFVRSESSRSTPGHGLGLALVQAIVTAHRGTVELSRSTDGFGIVLSLASAP